MMSLTAVNSICLPRLDVQSVQSDCVSRSFVEFEGHLEILFRDISRSSRPNRIYNLKNNQIQRENTLITLMFAGVNAQKEIFCGSYSKSVISIRVLSKET